MKIDNEEEDENILPLPRPRGNRGEMGGGLPPSSRGNLINTGPRFKRKKIENILEEKEKQKEEQIYNKNKEEEEEKVEEAKKVQIQFMKPNGSFIFQTLMEFHQVYSIIYFIIEELLMAYKIKYLPIRAYAAGFEIAGLIFYLFIQIGRFYFGALGNRAEAHIFVILCIALSVGVLYNYIHYLRLQTFVLRIEIVTNSVGIVLWILEIAFGMIAFLSISSNESGI